MSLACVLIGRRSAAFITLQQNIRVGSLSGIAAHS